MAAELDFDYTGPVLRPLLFAIAFFATPAALADDVSWAERQSDSCSAAIVAAEVKHATLPGLLGAIAKAESGRPIPPRKGLQPWPWAVNADGGAYYFDSKAAAVAWVGAALQRGVGQIDVGCMQINLQSHPTAFTTIDQALDPVANADYAARFLLQLQANADGNWYDAVGHYHSRTPALAENYRQRVSAIAQGKPPPPGLGGLPLYVRAIRQGTLRIQLAGGGVLRLNLRRQPSRTTRQLSACQVASVLGDFMAAPARARCFAAR